MVVYQPPFQFPSAVGSHLNVSCAGGQYMNAQGTMPWRFTCGGPAEVAGSAGEIEGSRRIK